MQNIRRMIIYMSINDNLFILYFHLNFDAKSSNIASIMLRFTKSC
jgi:hypothetical protein